MTTAKYNDSNPFAVKFEVKCGKPSYLNLVILCLFSILSVTHAENMQHRLSHIDKQIKRVSRERLPTPFDYLLTQPLLTKAITHYYQRTPWIEKIYAVRNRRNNTYERAILMYVDTAAHSKSEKLVVELAFIIVNFNALPKKLIHDVLYTNVPFGQLLADSHIEIMTANRSYFSVKCTVELASLMHCNISSTLYGRRNTIIRAQNHQWIAHTVEILSGNDDTS